MDNKNYITACCSIRSGNIQLNGNTVFTDNTSTNAVDFLKSAYKHQQINYPKFYKMDSLCKLAFIASEILLKSNNIKAQHQAADIAIIIANSASSLQIDTDHQTSINDADNYFPSPAVFVYTLPNILIGEIAIRNNIKGENTFFIFDKFDAYFMSNNINSLLNNNRASCCIGGWVDFYEDKYEAFLYTVEKQKGILKDTHTPEELKRLYNN
jgi:hypothetical protein